MSINSKIIAPGHVYQPGTKTGVEWTPDKVRLWNRGALLGEAEHSYQTAYDYWLDLAYAKSFPQVEKWWFFSVWSGQVVVEPPNRADNGAVYGVIRFPGGEKDTYWIENCVPIAVDVPLPAQALYPGNIPLRVALARLVMGVMTEEVVAGKPYTVTSLVGRGALERLFATTPVIPELDFVLSDVGPQPLRSYFCRLMGLKPAAPETV